MDDRLGLFDDVGLTHNIVSGVMMNLFEKEINRLNQFIVNLSKENDELYGSYAEGFLFNGNPYKIDNRLIVKITRPLHDSLAHKMLGYLKDAETIGSDHSAIRMVLAKLVGVCRSCDEVRDNLPPCLEDCLNFQYLAPRAHHPGYLLKDERSMRQYLKVLPRIQFYSAARLIY